jgi:2-dehydropantoate 2-reductase
LAAEPPDDARAGPRIVVAGAGAIGCFVGGLLAEGGRDVTLLLRPRTKDEIRSHGLTLTDFAGFARRVDPDRLRLATDPRALAKASIVLVTVKSGDTARLAQQIAVHGRQDATVISLQNGTANAAALARALPGRDVRGGMVPFNVVPLGEGGLHRATSGDIVIGAGPGGMARLLTVPGLAVTESADIEGILWGKFLINLNNAINALSGLPLAEQLRQRDWRRLMADQWAEALRVLRAGGIRPRATTGVPVGLIPAILRLPTPLFARVAASMLTIDAQARTSMAHDLMTGRPTEIDVLQGEVVRRGRALGRRTPISAMLLDVMQSAELAERGLPHLSAEALRREIGRSG